MLSENLKNKMIELHITTAELSRRSGVSKNTIYDITSGKHKRGLLNTYRALAIALGCSVSDLIN